MSMLRVESMCATMRINKSIGVDLSSILGANQTLGKGVNPGGGESRPPGFWGGEGRKGVAKYYYIV